MSTTRTTRLTVAFGLTAALVANPVRAFLGNADAAIQAATAKKSVSAKASPTQVSGPVIDTRWGPVQVRIIIAAKKIVDVTAPVYPHTKQRSSRINDRALPLLRTEVIAKQSATINNVSGATVTSDGYTGSLQQALDTAHRQGVL